MTKILLTGGGTGGHIFPLLAVARELKEFNENIEFSYIGPKHDLNTEFEKLRIKTYQIKGGKFRRYFSLKNLIDIPRFFFSFFESISLLNSIKPDVVFSKGGPGAFPVVFGSFLFRIPIIIHESDSIPGITNRLSAIFANKIAISFENAKHFFDKKKVIFTGNPIRKEFLAKIENHEEMKKKLGFDENFPLIFVFGGSQGSQIINNYIFKNLETLKEFTQIYHQVGIKNLEDVEKNLKSEKKYKFFGNLNISEMKNALTACDLIISRSGAGAIFEIANSGKPSILIPLKIAANDHQRKNAVEYAKEGGAEVFEEKDLNSEIIFQKIKEILTNSGIRKKMIDSAKRFSKPDASKKIANEILKLIPKK